ncbi:MAG: hypothetical protein FJ319_04130 [SAR202 cluster bacterium]|nr:hypothetical protein [SAR202 cluster bacterium]
MREEAARQAMMLTAVTPDAIVPKDHPIRKIKPLADAALARLSSTFNEMYAAGGRPSIPPEHLLKASLLSAAMVVLFESLRKRALVLVMAGANIGLLFVFDTLFFAGHSFSLDLGVAGTAWSSLISSALLFLIGVVLLSFNLKIPLAQAFSRPTFNGMREFVRVGAGSGLDSLVRNVFYFFMVIMLINTIGATEIGGYYLAMHILWSFMLVPILVFADSAKALVANS